MTIQVVIMAAGKGKRMNSALPKVLHSLAGVPLLERIVNTALQLNGAKVHVVYGHEGSTVRQAMSHLSVNWVEQTEQLGTGHAVAQVLPLLNPQDQILILNGDVPLITLSTLERLFAVTKPQEVGIITAKVNEPRGLGRIIRSHSGPILTIIEEKDATAAQREINEIYTGIMLANVEALQAWLPQITKNNAQGEYYLTEIVSIASSLGLTINSVMPEAYEEVLGVNSRSELANLERYWQRCSAERLMAAGATIMDPARIDIRGEVTVEPDVTIDVNVVFEGKVHVGRNSIIGPNCVIKNTDIGKNVKIHSHSVLDGARIADHCSIGPFARLRPGTEMLEHAKIGNFVETKKAVIGVDSKVSHLSYIGDALLGTGVNVGAGTITCNYDGVNKHRTTIEDGAFIGSGTQLVAPVTIGTGGTIGAGSTITRNTPAAALTISRAKQQSIEGWQRKEKK
jgi:bifunctional UDP-N-acetylglucosamine pyrophosphorylase/glucosamine-1-phosphate N-acetyltransferase